MNKLLKLILALNFLLLLAFSVYAADVKGSALLVNSNPSATDELITIKSPGSNPASYTWTIQNVVNSGLANPGPIGATPNTGNLTNVKAANPLLNPTTGYSNAGAIVCDGTTDNLAILQSSLTSGGAGVTITLPPGVCAISGELQSTASHQRIKGSGKSAISGSGTTLKYSGAMDATKAVIHEMPTYDGLAVESLTVNANGSAGMGVFLEGKDGSSSHQPSITDVLVTGYTDKGIVIGKNSIISQGTAEFNIVPLRDVTWQPTVDHTIGLLVNAQNCEFCSVSGPVFGSTIGTQHDYHIIQYAAGVRVFEMSSSNARVYAISSSDQLNLLGWRAEERYLIKFEAVGVNAPSFISSIDQRYHDIVGDGSGFPSYNDHAIEIDRDTKGPVTLVSLNLQGSIYLGSNTERVVSTNVEFRLSGAGYLYAASNHLGLGHSAEAATWNYWGGRLLAGGYPTDDGYSVGQFQALGTYSLTFTAPLRFSGLWAKGGHGAFTMTNAIMDDYTNFGLAGIAYDDSLGYPAVGTFGVGKSGSTNATGGRFYGEATAAIPAYGTRSKVVSFTGGTGYGSYLDAAVGSGTNYGYYQAGTEPNYFAGAVNTSGNLTGKVGIVSTATDYTLGTGTTNEAYGYKVLVTAAATIHLPTAVVGMNACVMSTGANLVSVKPGSSDSFVLNGVTLTAAHKASSSSLAGDTLCFFAGAANNWYVIPGINVDWTDGGL